MAMAQMLAFLLYKTRRYPRNRWNMQICLEIWMKDYAAAFHHITEVMQMRMP